MEVEAIGKVCLFTRDESIFREGDLGDCMYVILSGKVVISKNAGSGHSQFLTTVGIGECFGEMSLIDSQSRSAHAVAQEPTILRSFCREDLRQLLIINSQIIINLLKTFSERVRTTNAQFIEHVVRKEKLALVGQMARSIIHDIKNPLTIIRMQAELVERETGARAGVNRLYETQTILRPWRTTCWISHAIKFRLNSGRLAPSPGWTIF